MHYLSIPFQFKTHEWEGSKVEIHGVISKLRVRCRDPLLLSQWSEWTPWTHVTSHWLIYIYLCFCPILWLLYYLNLFIKDIYLCMITYDFISCMSGWYNEFYNLWFSVLLKTNALLLTVSWFFEIQRFCWFSFNYFIYQSCECLWNTVAPKDVTSKSKMSTQMANAKKWC